MFVTNLLCSYGLHRLLLKQANDAKDEGDVLDQNHRMTVRDRLAQPCEIKLVYEANYLQQTPSCDESQSELNLEYC